MRQPSFRVYSLECVEGIFSELPLQVLHLSRLESHSGCDARRRPRNTKYHMSRCHIRMRNRA